MGTATGTHVAVAGLREAVSQLEVHTPGEACAIRWGMVVGFRCCWDVHWAGFAVEANPYHDLSGQFASLPTSRHSLHRPVPPLLCPHHRSVPRPPPLLLGGLLEAVAVRDELTTQNLGPAPCFVMVTTAGVLKMEKMRPVDVLAQVGAGSCEAWGTMGMLVVAL